MSTLASSSTPAPVYPTLAIIPDADFDRRWTAWKARGFAHERAVRHRFLIAAIVAGGLGLAAVVARVLLLP